jgi:diguanylate cyclase (GGDEF)-like protein
MPFPGAMRGHLARLEGAREQLAKNWLMRVIERSSLRDLEGLPLAWVSRELAEMVAGVLHAVAEAEPGSRPEVSDDELERAKQLGLLHQGPDAAARLAANLATLQAVLIGALGERVPPGESAVIAMAAERLAEVFGDLQAAAAGALVRGRQWEQDLDSLTGLKTNDQLRTRVEGLIEAEKRYGHPFTLLLLDVEGLKRMNDAGGRDAGDRVLQAVAGSVRGDLRVTDEIYRLGDDEFCVLAPNQTAPQARLLAERLAGAVGEIDFADGLRPSVAVGVVSCPEHGRDASRLLELADTAMYQARAEGRAVEVA